MEHTNLKNALQSLKIAHSLQVPSSFLNKYRPSDPDQLQKLSNLFVNIDFLVKTVTLALDPERENPLYQHPTWKQSLTLGIDEVEQSCQEYKDSFEEQQETNEQAIIQVCLNDIQDICFSLKQIIGNRY